MRIGDKVRCTAEISGNKDTKGRLGTVASKPIIECLAIDGVREIAVQARRVTFSKTFKGHDCAGRVKGQHSYWIPTRCLKIIKKKRA